jgi:AraC family transcriptional regulator
MGITVVRDSTLRSHYESVERVITMMRSQIDQPMTLQQMARIGSASPYHFNRTFRQVTGVPPLQFLYALRLDAAKRLLTQTHKKVIDICYEVGYNSVGTFTRRFADVLGVSPTGLRKLARSHPGASTAGQAAKLRRSRPKPGTLLEGYVTTPSGFHGLVAVGLFTTSIPQSQPVSCTVVKDGGAFALKKVPQGNYYLFAVGLTKPSDGSVCFDYAAALRAGGLPIRVADNTVQGCTALQLRPPSPFDPPVLLVVPQEKLELV